jgi:glycosyltransferase involved in cell wall biosynthesis
LRAAAAVMPESRKLTVLQVLPELQSGGVERGTQEVGKHLAERGHRSIVISAGGRMVEQLVSEGSEHIAWDIGRKSPWTLRLILRLQRFLIENKVDVLHARSRMPAWICYLAWKGMDPQSRPRFLTTVHGLYSVNAYSAIMTRGEKMIAVSETARDYILRNYPDASPQKIVVIHRGVERADYPHGYRPAQEWTEKFFGDFPNARNKIILTLPGRITWVKGHEDFIEIVRRLKQDGLPVHGLIAGGAAGTKQRYLKKLQGIIAAAGLGDTISFTGQRSDMKEILALSSLVLSPGRHPESFGRTTLESLYLGVPTAGYNHGGVSEILRRIYPAGLLPLNDLGETTRIIARLLNNPPPVPAGDFFPLSRMLEETLHLYETLASEVRP